MGAGRPATWADAIQVAREAAHAIDAPLVVRAARRAPWHPGRCAELLVDTGPTLEPIGYAGELHPRAIAALGLPARTAALELDLTALAAYAEDLDVGPTISGFPLAKEDVALVVAEDVTAASVEEALRAGAGELLESLRLFDVYRDERLGAGRKSLGVRAALPRARPDADRRRGLGGQGRGGRRGGSATRRGAAQLSDGYQGIARNGEL